MGWPIARDSFQDVDDLFYDFTAEELGIDPKTAAKIQNIALPPELQPDLSSASTAPEREARLRLALDRLGARLSPGDDARKIIDKGTQVLPRAAGCDACAGTGYVGRAAVVEILQITD